MSVAEETAKSVIAATHLTDMDLGAVAALHALAARLDQLGPESTDNVTIPTYLKYCDALGLTPAGRRVPVAKAKPETEAVREPVSSLGRRRASHLRPA